MLILCEENPSENFENKLETLAPAIQIENNMAEKNARIFHADTKM
jgi:hypothetical protein